ncbi:WD40 repeat domain-containing protein [Micromonospora sp. NBC_01412]|uniref:WD40 repeat domain-containing protein n=1 Tax=Micromonospora sp. NBC_01412 TaxID=2903590 RepID=UPI003863C582
MGRSGRPAGRWVLAAGGGRAGHLRRSRGDPAAAPTRPDARAAVDQRPPRHRRRLRPADVVHRRPRPGGGHRGNRRGAGGARLPAARWRTRPAGGAVPAGRPRRGAARGTVRGAAALVPRRRRAGAGRAVGAAVAGRAAGRPGRGRHAGHGHDPGVDQAVARLRDAGARGRPPPGRVRRDRPPRRGRRSARRQGAAGDGLRRRAGRAVGPAAGPDPGQHPAVPRPPHARPGAGRLRGRDPAARAARLRRLRRRRAPVGPRDRSGGARPRRPPGAGERPVAVPAGDTVLLASGGDDRGIRFWEPETGRQLRAVGREVRWSVRALCTLSVDGQLLLAAGYADGAVRLWDPVQLRLVRHLGAQRCGVNALCAVTVDGAVRLASAGGDGTVALWDPATGERLGSFDDGPPVRALRGGDGRRGAPGHRRGRRRRHAVGPGEDGAPGLAGHRLADQHAARPDGVDPVDVPARHRRRRVPDARRVRPGGPADPPPAGAAVPRRERKERLMGFAE